MMEEVSQIERERDLRKEEGRRRKKKKEEAICQC